MKIIQRLDEANRRISDSWQFWNYCQTSGMMPTEDYARHIFSNEEAVYMLRIAADELVSLIWLLSKFEKDKVYPKKIEIDCLGAVITNKQDCHEAFSEHIEIMTVLNDISNAFKHSFINSDHTLLGAKEPRVHALGLKYNKLNSEPAFYDYSLSKLIKKYNAFYNSCIKWLSSYSERNR